MWIKMRGCVHACMSMQDSGEMNRRLTPERKPCFVLFGQVTVGQMCARTHSRRHTHTVRGARRPASPQGRGLSAGHGQTETPADAGGLAGELPGGRPINTPPPPPSRPCQASLDGGIARSRLRSMTPQRLAWKTVNERPRLRQQAR